MSGEGGGMERDGAPKNGRLDCIERVGICALSEICVMREMGLSFIEGCGL